MCSAAQVYLFNPLLGHSSLGSSSGQADDSLQGSHCDGQPQVFIMLTQLGVEICNGLHCPCRQLHVPVAHKSCAVRPVLPTVNFSALCFTDVCQHVHAAPVLS